MMDHLRTFKFYLDGNLLTPRDLHYNFKTKVLTYNIEVEIGYLDKNDGRFHFTAGFDTNVICDVGLDKKKKSIVSNTFSNDVLFDGFSDPDTGKEQTKSIFLKSLRKIKELTDDPNQIKLAEEQNPEIHIDIYKCQRNQIFGQSKCIMPSSSNKTFLFGNSKGAFGSTSQTFGGSSQTFGGSSQTFGGSSQTFGGSSQTFEGISKPVFVETSQVNSSAWTTVDCKKEEKLMTVKITIIIVEKADDKTFKII